MGDRMKQIPFLQLLEWIFSELEKDKSIFGVHYPYKADLSQMRTLFGRNLETPIGPAAGPHTQLAQNIVAAYYGGSRFFELKTVQIIDGEDLPVSKPCIKAEDECYNVEWSTELYVSQALEEYVKAWILLNVLSIELGLGSKDGFQFNMSVGYDLEGIKSKKIDTFIESLKEAKNTEIFQSCIKDLLEYSSKLKKVTKEDILSLSSNICNCVTLSTLHGCPPQEIERIAVYLMEEKGLHTFIKCNPTLLGYTFARKTMDEMGYDYVAFGDFHFLDDLQYEDAVPMLRRLMEIAKGQKLEFGVKITNTFPVDIKQNELPGKEMYMSGKSLYPLSISVAAKLAKDFNGKIRIAYSGGADYYNIRQIIKAGIWPVTVATTLLKPGGYQRLLQLAQLTQSTGEKDIFDKVDVQAVEKLALESVSSSYHKKAGKPLPERKIKKQVPMLDCAMAPCKEGCPIHQDITEYMFLAEKGKYKEALGVIIRKNPLPFITGTICAHNCMNRCTRNFYEEPVHIRGIKLLCAKKGYDSLMKSLKKRPVTYKGKAAIIGGGPAGISAAFFLAREGMQVTLLEQKDSLGGVIRHIIPDFRISEEAISKDIALMKAMGVEVKCNNRITDLEEMKKQGYDSIVLAIGATVHSELILEEGQAINAVAFLEEFKKNKGKVKVGSHVIVIGGGNTAMDTARALTRVEGVLKVTIVYRRTKRYMPAEAEELQMAMEEKVEFRELLSPKSFEKGKLICQVMELDKEEKSARRSVTETGETIEIQADTVIAATGENVPSEFYKALGIEVSKKGTALVNLETMETNKKGVYVIGDGLNGPATVVEAIRDAKKASKAILSKEDLDVSDNGIATENRDIYKKRGILSKRKEMEQENSRCLSCSAICECCVEVCPNRANIKIVMPETKKHQVLHMDSMCNECGNCKSFCPYDSSPYLDKFTLFAKEADMLNSKNQGFVILDTTPLRCKVRWNEKEYEWCQAEKKNEIPKEIGEFIQIVCRDYDYLSVL